jgi:hypothetical protein
MFIPDPDLDFLPIPDPGVIKAPDPGSGSATLARGETEYLIWSEDHLENGRGLPAHQVVAVILPQVRQPDVLVPARTEHLKPYRKLINNKILQQKSRYRIYFLIFMKDFRSRI